MILPLCVIGLLAHKPEVWQLEMGLYISCLPVSKSPGVSSISQISKTYYISVFNLTSRRRIYSKYINLIIHIIKCTFV